MASVVAVGKCWLLALSERRFWRIVEHNPRLRQVIEQLIARRDQRNEISLREMQQDTGLDLI